MDKKELRDLILQEAAKGNIVFMTFDGVKVMNLDEFIKQPAEGILYDLNRDKATVLTFLDDPKWINDFAVALVIEKMRPMLDAAKKVDDTHNTNDKPLSCPVCGKTDCEAMQDPPKYPPEVQAMLTAVRECMKNIQDKQLAITFDNFIALQRALRKLEEMEKQNV